MPAPTTYALVFTFPEVIVGKGFTARVEVHGHAVLTQDGDVWIYGVQPGAIAGGGKDYAEACREFKKGYLSVLFDMALEASTYDVFAADVRKFFSAVNEPNRTAWESSLISVRQNPSSLAGWATVKAEAHPPRLEIQKLDQRSMQPTINRFDKVEVAEAA